MRSHAGLTAFNLTMRAGEGGASGGTMSAAEDGSTDILVEAFSIAAPKVKKDRDKTHQKR